MESTQYEGKFKCIALPESITFEVKDETSYGSGGDPQFITLYNPFTFDIQYITQCTSSKSFVVLEPKGRLGPNKKIVLKIAYHPHLASVKKALLKIIVEHFDDPTVKAEKIIPITIINKAQASSSAGEGSDTLAVTATGKKNMRVTLLAPLVLSISMWYRMLPTQELDGNEVLDWSLVPYFFLAFLLGMLAMWSILRSFALA